MHALSETRFGNLRRSPTTLATTNAGGGLSDPCRWRMKGPLQVADEATLAGGGLSDPCRWRMKRPFTLTINNPNIEKLSAGGGRRLWFF